MGKQASSSISPLFITHIFTCICAAANESHVKTLACGEKLHAVSQDHSCLFSTNLNHMLLDKVPIADEGERSHCITPMMSA